MQNIIDGLQILHKYECDVFTEHDLIGVAFANDPSYTDVLQLEKLGWWYDRDQNAWCWYI